MRPLAPFALALLGACALSRPAFVEPGWGNAPPPLPEQIAEITHEVLHCTHERCWTEAFVLRRDGVATWSYQTGERVDSVFRATIDAATFYTAATTLAHDDWFWGPDGAEVWTPLTTIAIRTSASILCRRRVVVHEGFAGKLLWQYIPPSIPRIDSLARGLSWNSCGIDFCVPRDSSAGREPLRSAQRDHSPSNDAGAR